ncbi:hypothetical protein [Vannielia litorea]|uniref:hypothetical protein n=1 Tax=Vannielia litorea TaxID=1217970 RepID=UPI001BCB21CF|nr:hypothetical protein [Vannielia litorea]
MILLAGCTTSGEAPRPMGKPLGYELRPTGVGVPGSPQEVSFDRVLPGAEISLAKLAGPVTARESCGPGMTRITFREGLVATFRGREFVGWQAEGRSAGATC